MGLLRSLGGDIKKTEPMLSDRFCFLFKHVGCYAFAARGEACT